MDDAGDRFRPPIVDLSKTVTALTYQLVQVTITVQDKLSSNCLTLLGLTHFTNKG